MTRLRLGTPTAAGGVELVTINRHEAYANAPSGRVVGFASAEPVAVVVRQARGPCALDLSGRAVPIDELTRDVSELADWLAGRASR